MAQRPDGKSGKTDRVVFVRPAAERISKVVRIVEAGDRASAPLRFDRVGGGRGTPVRFCSWATASWNRGSTATVTFSSGQTATATNVLLGVGPGDGWAASKGTVGWQLIGVDLTLQPGYSTASIQVFGHDENKIAHWYSITTCATATSA